MRHRALAKNLYVSYSAGYLQKGERKTTFHYLKESSCLRNFVTKKIEAPSNYTIKIVNCYVIMKGHLIRCQNALNKFFGIQVVESVENIFKIKVNYQQTWFNNQRGSFWRKKMAWTVFMSKQLSWCNIGKQIINKWMKIPVKANTNKI